MKKNYVLQIDPGPTHIPLKEKKNCPQPIYDNCDNTFAITVIYMVYVLTYDFAALAQQKLLKNNFCSVLILQLILWNYPLKQFKIFLLKKILILFYDTKNTDFLNLASVCPWRHIVNWQMEVQSYYISMSYHQLKVRGVSNV